MTKINARMCLPVDAGQIFDGLAGHNARAVEELMCAVETMRPGRDISEVAVGPLRLPGDLQVSQKSNALIVFAHGSGSSRHSPRNRAVAHALNERGMATLLFDLLAPAEEQDRRNVFDIPLLAERLVGAVQWIDGLNDLAKLPLGFFGASTGAAAALVAAAYLGSRIGAVVSRGGRPDLAGPALERLTAPTLFIVGGFDEEVIVLNERAFAQLSCEKALQIVPGATHLFPEPGALEKVIELAGDWFERHLIATVTPEEGEHAIPGPH